MATLYPFLGTSGHPSAFKLSGFFHRNQMNAQADFQFEISISGFILAFSGFFIQKLGKLAILKPFWGISGHPRAFKLSEFFFRHQMNTQADFQFKITILSVIMAFFVLKRGNLATLQPFWGTSGFFRALKV